MKVRFSDAFLVLHRIMQRHRMIGWASKPRSHDEYHMIIVEFFVLPLLLKAL